MYFSISKSRGGIWYESELAAKFGRQNVNSGRKIQAETAMQRPEFLE